jgi:FKBP-type peptidyl-prolyl cis-trans isomerase 2
MKVELAVVNGDTLEKSTVEYIQGGGTMLPGLEKVLEGLEKGAKKDGVIAAKDAFGNPSMHPVKKIPRTEFPKDAKLKAGDRFQAKGAAGGMDVVLQIEKVSDTEVETRLVHPLADKDIKYVVEIIQVSDPKPPPMPAQALELEPDPES